ncbi:MAG: DUF4038 domain-containing protein [Spirosomataceae bacterium]
MKNAFLFLCCFISTLIAFPQNGHLFPLKFSENKRYLIDNTNKPFLIKEFSAWGLLQAISEAEEAAFLDSLKEEGFNAVMVSMVSNASSQMGGNPPYWQGISPFTVEWDFSTPNETYFKHVDWFLKMAESKGFLVILVPCYWGYYTDAGQGWWDEVRGEKNSPDKMKRYGEFLGKRYQNTPNILWVAGGDNDAKGIDEPYMKNLIAGIKTYDKEHVWTGHFNNGSGHFWSTDNPLYRDVIDIDGEYVWQEISMGERGPQYVSELNQYKKGRMTIQLDQSYEHDVPHNADNENPQWIRRKMYEGLLSGCAGTSFSSGTLENQCYWFKDWKPLMNTPGMKDAARCFHLFDRLPWHDFVPDTSRKIIVEGRGVYGSREYICAARSKDARFYVMYIPKGGTFYINVKEISSQRLTVHWYNPRTGKLIRIGQVKGDERFGVIAPTEEDWVMVFSEGVDFNMPDVGTATVNALTKLVNPGTVHAPRGYSHAAVTDLGTVKMVFIAGQVALDRAGNLVGKDNLQQQTEQVFQNIKSIVEAEGGTMENIVKLNYFMRDVAKIQAVREVRDKFINAKNPPVSTLVEVSKLFREDIFIEIEATAMIPKQ